MKSIKVNAFILNRRPGDIVGPEDEQYDAFKTWAKNKDRHDAQIICSFCEDPETESASEVAGGEVSGMTPGPTLEGPSLTDESPNEPGPRKDKKGK